QDRALVDPARAVEQDVDVAYFGRGRRDGGLVGDVERPGANPGPEIPERGGVLVGRPDRRAFPRKGDRRRPAHPLARPGDQGDFPGQPTAHDNPRFTVKRSIIAAASCPSPWFNG